MVDTNDLYRELEGIYLECVFEGRLMIWFSVLAYTCMAVNGAVQFPTLDVIPNRPNVNIISITMLTRTGMEILSERE